MQHKVVQIPLTFKDKSDDALAAYLQKLIDEQSASGWEFYHVETVTFLVPAGCLASLFSRNNMVAQLRSVAVFRKI